MAKQNKHEFFEQAMADTRKNRPTELTETLDVIDKKRLAEKNQPEENDTPTAKKLAMTGLIDIAAQEKKKREKKKNVDATTLDGIEFGGIAISSGELAQLEEISASINATGFNVKLHADHNLKLSMLAMQLRHKYRLPNKSGINLTKLVYLILQKTLENVKL